MAAFDATIDTRALAEVVGIDNQDPLHAGYTPSR